MPQYYAPLANNLGLILHAWQFESWNYDSCKSWSLNSGKLQGNNTPLLWLFLMVFSDLLGRWVLLFMSQNWHCQIKIRKWLMVFLHYWVSPQSYFQPHCKCQSHCPSTGSHFELLATSPHLKPFAVCCGHMTVIYDFLARCCYLLPVPGEKMAIGYNGFI